MTVRNSVPCGGRKATSILETRRVRRPTMHKLRSTLAALLVAVLTLAPAALVQAAAMVALITTPAGSAGSSGGADGAGSAGALQRSIRRGAQRGWRDRAERRHDSHARSRD